jgi:hypothetical protein
LNSNTKYNENSKSLGLLDSVLKATTLGLKGVSDCLQFLPLPLPFIRFSLYRFHALSELASGGLKLAEMMTEVANLIGHLLLGFLGLPQGTLESEFLSLVGLQDSLKLGLLFELNLDLSS